MIPGGSGCGPSQRRRVGPRQPARCETPGRDPLETNGRGLRRRLVRFFQRGSQSRLLLAGATGLGVTTLGFSWAAGVAPTTPIVPIAVVLPPVGSSSTSTPLPPPPPVTVPGTTSTTQPGGQHPPPPPPPPPPQHQPAPTQSGPGPASGNAAPAGRANPGAAPGSFPAALGSGDHANGGQQEKTLACACSRSA